ncbi:Transcriptional regulatory protein LnrK [Baekduia alba]|uniref:response regulator n=1 Tax=Baekduia alba TaxID=2997333 RepID=UPI002341B476|nr:response regulator transcription factor [Baekduia alba]WCB91657.1 Transcriptional regulatory protein LnrK [Baekduia alba]
MPSLSVPLVVVDDHPMVVLGLRTLFHQRPEVEVVAYAHDAAAALAACREHRPRVVILDVALEGSPIDGFALCRRVRAEIASVEVVFYTGREEIGIANQAFAAGAHGVVSKADASSDLLRAILLVSRGKTYTSPVFAARAEATEFGDLSPKQLAVLRHLAEGRDRKEMAQRMGIGEETVKTHLAEVRRKLGARTSAQAVAIGLLNALFDPAAAP